MGKTGRGRRLRLYRGRALGFREAGYGTGGGDLRRCRRKDTRRASASRGRWCGREASRSEAGHGRVRAVKGAAWGLVVTRVAARGAAERACTGMGAGHPRRAAQLILGPSCAQRKSREEDDGVGTERKTKTAMLTAERRKRTGVLGFLSFYSWQMGPAEDDAREHARAAVAGFVREKGERAAAMRFSTCRARKRKESWARLLGCLGLGRKGKQRLGRGKGVGSGCARDMPAPNWRTARN